MEMVAVKCTECGIVTSVDPWRAMATPCPKCGGRCNAVGKYVERIDNKNTIRVTVKADGLHEIEKQMKRIRGLTIELPTPPRVKPPLGAKPTWLVLLEQIQELSGAIERHVNDGPGHAELIKKWAEEVLILADMLDRVRR